MSPQVKLRAKHVITFWYTRCLY